MISKVDYSVLSERRAQTIDVQKPPRKMKHFSHHKDRKGISEGVVLECLRLWEKEKKNRNKISTLKILKAQDNLQRAKELQVFAFDNQSQQFQEFQDSSSLPTINSVSEGKEQNVSLQAYEQSSLNMVNKTKNMFRVKLPYHVSKSKSISDKATQEDNISELNIDLKKLSHRSVQRNVRQADHKKNNQTISHFSSWRNKNQIRSIKIQEDLLQSNNFVLSPW